MSNSNHFEPIVVNNPKKSNLVKQPWFVKLFQKAVGPVSHVLPNLLSYVILHAPIGPKTRAKHRYIDDILKSIEKEDFIINKGRKIKYYQWKKAEKNVLLVHGWESRGTALKSIVPYLIKAGYGVFAIDFPSHGGSEGNTTDHFDAADIIHQFYREVVPFNSIVAHSFGAAAAMIGLSQNKIPAIDSIVLAGSPLKFKDSLDRMKVKFGLSSKFVSKIESNFYKKFNYKIDDISFINLRPKLKINKILVVHDKKDDAIPFELAVEFVEKYPEVYFQASEGLGHFRLFKNEKVLERIANFITEIE